MQGAKKHVLDRHAITRVKCAQCGLEQRVARQCASCLQQFGKYSCLECNFFDENVSKRQFHCHMCGICRVGALLSCENARPVLLKRMQPWNAAVGGREHFFHCEQCGCCYQTGLQENHHCVQNNMGKPCLMCSENLFDSVKEIITLPCGVLPEQVHF
jgi:RING finger and CHY zinc finger domain-containing protein 1